MASYAKNWLFLTEVNGPFPALQGRVWVEQIDWQSLSDTGVTVRLRGTSAMSSYMLFGGRVRDDVPVRKVTPDRATLTRSFGSPDLVWRVERLSS